ncbi:hypothetical protein ACFQ1S_15290 [Kibdelosporangium lantanae]|uniref:Dihydrofolate reductase n=1 Tax=Kibdelosporangium lantanae TaxID=1497396 RepID=A0ABW3M7W3_9PSEU
MAGKVFFSVSMSLDGFIAPASLSELMGKQWMELQSWVFPTRFFRENLKLGEGGEESALTSSIASRNAVFAATVRATVVIVRVATAPSRVRRTTLSSGMAPSYHAD